MIQTPVSIIHYTVSSVTVLKQWWQWLLLVFVSHLSVFVLPLPLVL